MNATQYVIADSVTILAGGYGSYLLFKNGNYVAGGLLAGVVVLNAYYLSQDIKNVQSGTTGS